MKNFICKILKLDIKTLLIIILIITILLMRACDRPNDVTTTNGGTVKVDGKPYTIVKHTTDTIYVPKNIVVYKKGQDIYHDIPVYVNVPKDVDTNEILKDYFASVTYTDTITLTDSLGQIKITDVVSKNRIQDRKFEANIKEKIIRDSIILKEKARRQLYFGINGSFTQQSFINSVGVGFIYKDKKDKVFLLGVGAQQNPTTTLTPYVQGGLYWKIKLK